MAKKKKVSASTPALRLLSERGIPHEVETFDGGTAHFGENAAAQLDVDPAFLLKTLVVDLHPQRPGRTLGVCCVPVHHTLSLKKAAKAFGVSHAEMAAPAAAQRSSGYVPGGISPIAQKNPLPTLIDASVEGAERVWVSGGKRGVDVSLSAADLAAATDGQFADVRHEEARPHR